MNEPKFRPNLAQVFSFPNLLELRLKVMLIFLQASFHFVFCLLLIWLDLYQVKIYSNRSLVPFWLVLNCIYSDQLPQLLMSLNFIIDCYVHSLDGQSLRKKLMSYLMYLLCFILQLIKILKNCCYFFKHTLILVIFLWMVHILSLSYFVLANLSLQTISISPTLSWIMA